MSESPTPQQPALRLGRPGIPLYSFIAPFPLSFFLGAVVFDCLNAAGIMRQGGAVAHGAFHLLIAGIVAAAILLVLAILEIRKLQDGRARKKGGVYIAFLFLATLCFVLAICLRPKPTFANEEKIPSAALVSSIIGGVSIIIASRIGSYLVFINRLAVSRPNSIFPTIPQARQRRPLHTLFAHLPLGLWFISLVFDITANWGENREPWCVKAAYLCIVAGCAAAVLAVVTGFVDWLMTHEEHPAHPWMIFHMLTTMAGTACFIFNAGERWTQINYLAPKANVIALSYIGYVVILVGGIVGMRLVYKENVAVAPGTARENLESAATPS